MRAHRAFYLFFSCIGTQNGVKSLAERFSKSARVFFRGQLLSVAKHIKYKKHAPEKTYVFQKAFPLQSI